MRAKQYKSKNGVMGIILTKIKSLYMSFIEITSLVLTFIAGGGLMKLVTLKSDKRKGKAQADREEINNLSEVTSNWQNLTNELQEQLKDEKKEKLEIEAKLEAKITLLESKLDDRWNDTISMRNDIQNKMLEIADLKVQLAKQEPMLCQVRGCSKREPQSGF